MTSDGPPLDLGVLARKAGEPEVIELSPYTVELLCGGTCRWCQERDVRIEGLEAVITELRTALRFNGVEGY